MKLHSSSISTAFAAFLLSMGAACGGTDTNPQTSVDGGKDGAKVDGAVIVDGGARDDAGNPAVPPSVDLKTAGSFVILAKSGISTVPTSAITGNLGVSPSAASYITGFGLIADATNVFSTSPQVTGKIFASDYAAPTPSNLTTAVSDMELAFTDAAGRAPNVTELGAGNIGGMTLTRGVYKWAPGSSSRRASP